MNKSHLGNDTLLAPATATLEATCARLLPEATDERRRLLLRLWARKFEIRIIAGRDF